MAMKCPERFASPEKGSVQVQVCSIPRSAINRYSVCRVVGCKGGCRYFGRIPRYWFPRFTEIPQIDLPNCPEMPPPSINYSKSIEVFQNYFKINRIYLCFKIIHNYSRFTQIPPSCFPFLFKTIEIEDSFEPANNYLSILVPRKFPKLSQCWSFDRFG